MLKSVWSLCALLGLASCTAASQGGPSMDLAGSEWGTDVKGQFVQFKQGGTMQGNGGCNRFSGSYSQKNKTIKMGPLLSTKMACGILQEETQFFNALSAADTAKISHTHVILTDAYGTEVLILRRRDWD